MNIHRLFVESDAKCYIENNVQPNSNNTTKELIYLGKGGEEQGASRGFFWPIEGFFGGVLALIPAEDVTEGIRELN